MEKFLLPSMLKWSSISAICHCEDYYEIKIYNYIFTSKFLIDRNHSFIIKLITSNKDIKVSPVLLMTVV